MAEIASESVADMKSECLADLLRNTQRIASRIAQLFSNDPFTGLVRMTFAAS